MNGVESAEKKRKDESVDQMLKADTRPPRRSCTVSRSCLFLLKKFSASLVVVESSSSTAAHKVMDECDPMYCISFLSITSIFHT